MTKKAMDDFDDVYDQLETLEVGNGLSQSNLDYIQGVMDNERKECIKKGGVLQLFSGKKITKMKQRSSTKERKSKIRADKRPLSSGILMATTYK